MPTFRITHLDGRIEDIHGDDLIDETATQVVITARAEAFGQPRTAIVRRLFRQDIRDVRELRP